MSPRFRRMIVLISLAVFLGIAIISALVH